MKFDQLIVITKGNTLAKKIYKKTNKEKYVTVTFKNMLTEILAKLC